MENFDLEYDLKEFKETHGKELFDPYGSMYGGTRISYTQAEAMWDLILRLEKEVEALS